jgi:cerevisin
MKFTSPAFLSLFSFAVLASANVIRQVNDSTIQHDGEHDLDGSTGLDETPGSGGDYVVIVDDEDPRTIEQLVVELGGSMDDIKYVYNNTGFKGFAGSMSQHCVTRMSTFSGITHFEPRTMFQASATIQEGDVAWGLQRISQTGPVGGQATDLAFTYTFNDATLGEGVDIYIVDTGVK